MIRKILLIALLLVFVPVVGAQDADETEVTFIEITGPAAERDAELSSLVWYGDYLLMITENPFIYAQEGEAGRFYALEREDITEYLDSDGAEPLEPFPVPIISEDIQGAVGGFAVAFDGFEAAAVMTEPGYFTPDRLFLTIEADTVNPDDPTMRSYVVSGTIEPDLSAINLDLDTFVEIPRQTDFNNMSYESLLVVDDALVAIYEANGEGPNPGNVAYEIDLMTGELAQVQMDNVNYRITDTTALEDGVFWAVNYFFAGEEFLAAENDPLFDEYGMGESQAAFSGFERLVAFQVTDEGIELVEQAPIQLLMTEDSNGRNWEGIVRLDDRGFLVVTDRFPVTLFGFVPVS